MRAAILVKWSLAGFAAGSLTILPHELGHFLVYLALDVPDPTLHYDRVSWDSQGFREAVGREDYPAAAGFAPVRGVALAKAAGPLPTGHSRSSAKYAGAGSEPDPNNRRRWPSAGMPS